MFEPQIHKAFCFLHFEEEDALALKTICDTISLMCARGYYTAETKEALYVLSEGIWATLDCLWHTEKNIKNISRVLLSLQQNTPEVTDQLYQAVINASSFIFYNSIQSEPLYTSDFEASNEYATYDKLAETSASPEKHELLEAGKIKSEFEGLLEEQNRANNVYLNPSDYRMPDEVFYPSMALIKNFASEFIESYNSDAADEETPTTDEEPLTQTLFQRLCNSLKSIWPCRDR